MNMKKVEIGFIKTGFRYQVVQFENGRFGVLDQTAGRCVSFGMDKMPAAEWALRLQLREAYGV